MRLGNRDSGQKCDANHDSRGNMNAPRRNRNVIEIKILETVVELNGEEGYLDGYYRDSRQKLLVGFHFEDIGPSTEQVQRLESFIENYDSDKTEYLEAIRQHFKENAENYFLPDEQAEMLAKLELPLDELEQHFEDPFIKVSYEDNLVFGFQSCSFNGEGGIGIKFEDSEISEIADPSHLD
jgi:hypothetical protein